MRTSIPSFTVPPMPSPRRARSRVHIDLGAFGKPWRWPLAKLDDEREPLVLAERVNERHAIDLGYDPRPTDGDRLVPVYSAQSGTIALAMEDDDPRSYFVIIEHGLHWASHYARLSRLHIGANRGTRALEYCQHVRAGDLIGYAGGSPLHVRFELWHWRERAFVPVDPLATLASWDVPALDVVHAIERDERGAA